MGRNKHTGRAEWLRDKTGNNRSTPIKCAVIEPFV